MAACYKTWCLLQLKLQPYSITGHFMLLTMLLNIEALQLILMRSYSSINIIRKGHSWCCGKQLQCKNQEGFSLSSCWQNGIIRIITLTHFFDTSHPKNGPHVTLVWWWIDFLSVFLTNLQCKKLVFLNAFLVTIDLVIASVQSHQEYSWSRTFTVCRWLIYVHVRMYVCIILVTTRALQWPAPSY